MSAPAHELRSAAARRLVGLYPAAWRRRYGPEILALIDDDPPGGAALLSLVLGAADAHARPQRSWSASLPAASRAGLSLSTLFSCWIVVSLMGIGFQKETEDPGFAAASRHHPLLAWTHDAILAGAAVGSCAIAFGGLPLLAQALRRALASRDRRLLGLMALPVVAALSFALLTWLLAAIAPSLGGGFPLAFVLEIMVPWQLGALAFAAVCAAVPRWVLGRVAVTPRALRRASRAGTALTLAIILLAVSLALYAVGLWAQAPRVSATGSGPVGASTGAMLVAQALAAALACALALVSSGRARGAAADTSR